MGQGFLSTKEREGNGLELTGGRNDASCSTEEITHDQEQGRAQKSRGSQI